MVEATSGFLQALLANLRNLRENAGLSTSELEERLIVGPGWITRFESGMTIPTIDMLLAILHQLGASLDDLLRGLPSLPEASEVERHIFAEQADNGIVIHFRYADHDAVYTLANSTLEEFEIVIKTLRNSLAHLTATQGNRGGRIKTDAVVNAFLKAVELWPHANPSDLWWFLISRAYYDPYNHPAQFARLNLDQSWKRTSGWALEKVLVRHYGPFLQANGIRLLIGTSPQKREIVRRLNVEDRLEADKIDVVLTGEKNGTEVFFGVVHVKASFAERRTDDVPMSRALIRAGYTSPFWTMDCKSQPSTRPINRGELGEAGDESRAKRRDIEEGYFSGCFSYNRNTIPSPESLPPERRIYVCDFRNSDDAFSQFILARWQAFQKA